MLEEGSGLSTEQTIDTGLPLIGSAMKMERFPEAGEEKRAAPPEFTLVLSPDFLCAASSSSVVTEINRRAHLHPDRDKCNDSSGRPRDDTAITAGWSFVFEMAPR